MKSALRQFGRLGYDGATNRMIAAEAGLTNGALYRHFPTKSDLYVATLNHTVDFVRGPLETAVKGTTALRETIRAACRVAKTLNAEDPLMAPFLANVRMDIRCNPHLAQSLDLGSDLTLEVERGARLPGSMRASHAETVECYRAALAVFVGGSELFALVSDSPADFSSLMEKADRVLEAAGRQAARAGHAIPGIDDGGT